ncbi:MAG: beta-propeller fold lactonase family protein [Fimbriimonadaceae bacterium]|nr:MAG: beta-propeller fold lactonase family protein [Fimbriimonadaceae bacterium]
MNWKNLVLAALGGAAILPGLVGCGGGGGSAASSIRMIAVGDNGQVAAYKVESNGTISAVHSDLATYDWVSVVPGRNPGVFYTSASDETQIGVIALVDDTDFTGDFITDSQAAGSKLFKHPTKNALYVMHAGLDIIEQFAINVDNSVTPLALATAPTDDQPTSMVFSKNGNYAYVIAEGSATVRAYQVSPNGTLTQLPGAVYAAGINPRKIVISDDGVNVYVMSATTNFRQAQVNSDGTLTPLNPVDVAYPMGNFRAAITGLNTLCFYRESDEGIETYGRNQNGTMSDLGVPNFATSGTTNVFRMPGQDYLLLLTGTQARAVRMGANGSGTEIDSEVLPAGIRDITFISAN